MSPKICAAAAVLAALATSIASQVNDAIVTPDFRGDPNSAHFEWINTGGAFSLITEEYFPDTAAGYSVFQGVSTDLSYQSGTPFAFLSITLPNIVDDLPEKHIIVQIVSGTGGIVPGTNGLFGGDGPFVTYFDDGQPFSTGSAQYFSDQQFFADGVLETTEVTISPNPDWEILSFVDLSFGGIDNIQRIVIDTISIPAPGATAVLAFAGATTLNRRRR